MRQGRITQGKTPRAGGRALAGTLALLVGSLAALVAARVPVVWEMMIGSGVEVGGVVASRWLVNLTEAAVVSGVLWGGWMFDRRRTVLLAGWATGGLALGIGLAWAGVDSAGAVLVGLALLASVGAGLVLVLGVAVPAVFSGRWAGLWLGLCLGGSLAATELVWGSASVLVLARGASWVLGRTWWLATATSLVGGAALALAWRWGWVGYRDAAGVERAEVRAPGAFLLLLVLSGAASFAGLLAQRGAAALSLVGLPEGSITSGVMVGVTFAVCRAGGALTGGLVCGLLGPRWATVSTTLVLGAGLLALCCCTGFDQPWSSLVGVVGVGSGMAVVVVPAAAVQWLGRGRFGSDFGWFCCAVALGGVFVLPLARVVQGHPRLMLSVVGVAIVMLGLGAARIGAPGMTAGKEPSALPVGTRTKG